MVRSRFHLLCGPRFSNFAFCIVLSIALFSTLPHVQADNGNTSQSFIVTTVTLNEPITPAAHDLIVAGIQTAQINTHSAVMIILDTPGGLVASMRDIVGSILNSPVPVFLWVGPEGARATSAGVFIVASSHIAAMSPNATIGAASPVQMGGKDVDSTMRDKVKNDLMSYVRGLAISRGRNAHWYQKAVDEAVSITAQEAAMEGVVEYLADSPEDFLEQIAAKGFVFGGRQVVVDPNTIRIVALDPSLRHKLLSWILNPQIAYLLLLGGIAGLFFELTTPGAILPGVFGGLCLLLALYALAILPTNTTGILLILFAVVLFILEVFITSFGMLGVAGLVSLFIGSLLLIRPTPGIEGVPVATILVTVGTLSLILGYCLVVITKSQRGKKAYGLEALVGMTCRITAWSDAKGKVLVRGEIWQAVSRSRTEMAAGDTAVVVKADGMTLEIEPLREVT